MMLLITSIKRYALKLTFKKLLIDREIGLPSGLANEEYRILSFLQKYPDGTRTLPQMKLKTYDKWNNGTMDNIEYVFLHYVG